MNKGMVSQDVNPQARNQSKFKPITIERSEQLVSRTIHILKRALIMFPTYAPHQAQRCLVPNVLRVFPQLIPPTKKIKHRFW